MRDYILVDAPNKKWSATRETCQHGHSGSNLPHLIVIHTAENTPDFNPPDDGAEKVAAWASSAATVSWHATVDSDSIVWMLPDTYEAWHARAYNDCAYGIEQATKASMWVGSPWPWREGILRNCAKVVAEVASENNIPLVELSKADVDAGKAGVVRHSTLDPGRKTDPGAAYPMDWMLDRAKEYQTPKGTLVMGEPQATAGQARMWIVARAQGGPYDNITLRKIATTYYEVGAEYGVRPDLALCQAAKETGFFKYRRADGTPGDVRPEQWNFAGIGATGGVPGISFASIEQGVRAHVLRMRMYAVNDPSAYDEGILVRPLPSTHWGKYPTIEQFNGVWAVPGTNYGQSIVNDYLVSLRGAEEEPVVAPLPPISTEERLADLERRVALLEGR